MKELAKLPVIIVYGVLLSIITVYPVVLGATPDYPGAIWIAAHPNNYTTANRENDYNINWIVIHVTQGSYSGTISWFQNPNAQASAHYIFKQDGTEITQMVQEKDIAWHAGNWDYNKHSIGLEHEGYVGSTVWPDALYQKSAEVVRYLANKYNIPKVHPTGVAPCDSQSSSGGIIGHNQVPDPNDCSVGGGRSHHTDPGSTWDWAKFMSYVTGAQPQPDLSSSYKAKSFPSTMEAGSSTVAWIEYTNTGSKTWYKSGTDEILLGTWNPANRTSDFYTSANWKSPTRPTELDQSSVASGNVGKFSFVITAPLVPSGDYTEYWRLIHNKTGQWFGDGSVNFNIHVQDTTKPAVAFKTPIDNEQVAGIYNITVDVTDKVGIKFVRVWFDGDVNTSAWMTYTRYYNWNTTLWSNGEHTITLQASDTANNRNSTTIKVIVNNSAPQPDTEAPKILHTPVTTAFTNQPITVRANITDNKIVQYANLHYKKTGESAYTPVAMTNTINDLYIGVIPAQSLPTTIYYYLESSDGANIAFSGNDSNPYIITVAEPQNHIPQITTFTGPATGEIEINYEFFVTANDEDYDNLTFTFDWGDNSTSKSAVVSSGEQISMVHSWIMPGIYTINVTVTDSNNTSASQNMQINIYEGLKVSVKASKEIVLPEETITVETTVTLNNTPVENATISLRSSITNVTGFGSSTGRTGSNGKYITEYKVPSVQKSTFLNITATANFTGYADREGYFVAEVILPGDLPGDLKNLTLMLHPEKSSMDSYTSQRVTVHVVDESNVALPGVNISLNVSDGTLSTDAGVTDDNGEFNITYFAPKTDVDKKITINVTASKPGYNNQTQSVEINIKAETPQNIVGYELVLISSTILVLLVAVWLVKLVKRKF